MRRELKLNPDHKLVLVTPGGGQDGDRILRTYTAALAAVQATPGVQSVIFTGPEMPASKRAEIEQSLRTTHGVEVREFTDDMMAYMDAADVVVCMAGYNTLCEIATLRKRAVVVPRVRPVEEQWIRAQRLTRAGVVRMVHPDTLTAETLAAAILSELQAPTSSPSGRLDLEGLPRINRLVAALHPPTGTAKSLGVVDAPPVPSPSTSVANPSRYWIV